ncbi:HAD family hydrolase [Marinobacterium jannaschii]|uniref:HAD family hydrolase n=1 Tax=Marinobacterium jannaschii TaxID=64970 RepID=UPI0004860409|nr:HAD family hydrolase [Marinobacterium jannaschii]
MQRLAQCSGWIFDLDGTLTRPVHDFDRIRQALGIPAAEDILGYIEAQPAGVQCTMRTQLDEWEHFYASQAQAAEGARELTALLAEQGVALGILTRNTREVAIRSLTAIGIAGYFEEEAILGRDEARPKPDAHGIEVLLNQWDISPERSVMVGDFKYDLEAGKGAGSATVHVDAGDRHWPELTDIRVSSLAELIGIFRP